MPSQCRLQCALHKEMTSSLSDSSGEDSDGSDAERRRRVAGIVAFTPVTAVTQPTRASRREGGGHSDEGDVKEDAFQRQAAALLHRYLDAHLDTSAPAEQREDRGADTRETAADELGNDDSSFRVFRHVRGPVLSGHGLLARPAAAHDAAISRSEARRRARPRRRGASDSEDEEKARAQHPSTSCCASGWQTSMCCVLSDAPWRVCPLSGKSADPPVCCGFVPSSQVRARAAQPGVAVDAAAIMAAAARAAAVAAAQLQAQRASESDDDLPVVIDRTGILEALSKPAKVDVSTDGAAATHVAQSHATATVPKLSQRAKKRLKRANIGND